VDPARGCVVDAHGSCDLTAWYLRVVMLQCRLTIGDRVATAFDCQKAKPSGAQSGVYCWLV
jgi:hypothetical protein